MTSKPSSSHLGTAPTTSTTVSSTKKSSSGRQPRSSKLICKERLACLSLNSEASIFCEECNITICTHCDAELHKAGNKRLHNHIRTKCLSPNPQLLCQSISQCTNHNFADICCTTCLLNLCWDCDSLLHSTAKKKKTHARSAFKAKEVTAEASTTSSKSSQALTSGLPEASSSSSGLRVTNGVSEAVASQGSCISNGVSAAAASILDESDNFFSFISEEEEDKQRTGKQKKSSSHCNGASPNSSLYKYKTIPNGETKSQLSSFSSSSSKTYGILNGKHDDQDNLLKPGLVVLSRSAPAMDDLESILNEVAADDAERSKAERSKAERSHHRLAEMGVGVGMGVGDVKPSKSHHKLYSGADQTYDESPGYSMDHPWNKVSEDARKERLSTCESVALFNENDELLLNSIQELLDKLKITKSDASAVKVLSIFGNTGDGKSFTLNHTFFGGENVFLTSSSQAAGTFGVWAAFDPFHKVLVLDTEGLLGSTANANRRTRMLLKVLAISDLVIYRTRAERLHTDMFNFLSDASEAYLKHFTKELQAACERGGLQTTITNMGPVAIVFHETQHTAVLGEEDPGTANDSNLLQPSAVEVLQQRFAALKKSVPAYAGLQYVGTKTPPNASTDFKPLQKLVFSLLRNNSVRSPRSLKVVLKTLQVLQDKFSGEISEEALPAFPDEYFTCSTRCLSCMVRCGSSMNHEKAGIPHSCTTTRCRYQHQYENRVFLCHRCLDAGKETSVVPKATSSKDNPWLGLAKYAWSGYVLECPSCGIIFRSRQFWYGNSDPAADASVVTTEVRHVWPGRGSNVLQGTENAARQLIDGVSYLSSAVMGITAKPTKMMMEWMNDQIAPAYWVPNAEIHACRSCTTFLSAPETKHHCRSCGGGFCDDCTAWRRPCPQRGWGDVPVRVCKPCFDAPPDLSPRDAADPANVGSLIRHDSGGRGGGGGEDDSGLTARRIEEAVQSTLGAVASAAEYPIEMLKDSVRPTYWRPDSEITSCAVCSARFGLKLRIHHCRYCGEGVCQDCSPHRTPVPARGWDHPVRVCATCVVNAPVT